MGVKTLYDLKYWTKPLHTDVSLEEYSQIDEKYWRKIAFYAHLLFVTFIYSFFYFLLFDFHIKAEKNVAIVILILMALAVWQHCFTFLTTSAVDFTNNLVGCRRVAICYFHLLYLCPLALICFYAHQNSFFLKRWLFKPWSCLLEVIHMDEVLLS